MATGSNKISPALSKYKTYDDWIKALSIWVKFTDLEKKQGPAVFLSLEGEAQEAVLELDEALITTDDGVKHITKRLDGLFKKDEQLKKYEALEAFESYKRSSSTSMQEFLNEFTRRYNKTKSHGTTMSEDILAYRLLKSANLSEQHEQLAKATANDLKFDVMKDQLKKIFGDLSCIPPTSSSVSQVKVEDINQVDDHQEVNPTMYQSYQGKYQQSRGDRNRSRGRGHSGGRGRGQYAFSHKGKPK